MQKQNAKTIWEHPWGFFESSLIVTALMISGFLIDFFSTKNNEFILSYPANIIALCILFVIPTALFLLFKKSNFLKWLRSAKLAIASIGWLLLLVLLMGVFKQENNTENTIAIRLNLNNILNSSAFILLQLILLINLWLALLNRFNKPNLRNISFVLNHLGIVIIIVALGFGNGDISKYTIKILKDNYTWKAKNGKQEIELPFAFKLLDFSLENFPAKIGIIDKETDEILRGNDKLLQAGHNRIIWFQSNKISMKKYLKNSVQFGKDFHPVNESGSCPSALIEISDETGRKQSGWISRGSYLYPSVLMPIDSNYTLAMLEPEAKSYKSVIAVYFKNGSTQKFTLEVNKPVNIDGWDIYQTDYHKEMGEWSDYSIIEIVRDPWLDVVYLGVFFMLAGVVLIIFTGKQKNNDLE